MVRVNLSDPSWNGGLAQRQTATPGQAAGLDSSTKQGPAPKKRDGSAWPPFLAGGLILAGSVFAYSRVRDATDSPLHRDTSGVAANDMNREGGSPQSAHTTPNTSRVSSTSASNQHVPSSLSTSEESTAEDTKMRQDDAPSVFRRTSHLIGRSIPSIELTTTPSVSAPELLRKIDIREAHANSIICLLPGMYDIRLEIRDEMWRAGWGQVNGGEFCQNALDALARNLHTIRARGLSLAIISGLAIPDKPVKELGVDLICDPDASFARLLDLSPLRYQGQEFLPRVAMLVRDGEIVSAFSETENFEAALNNLLALTQKSPNNSTQPPKASSNSQASRETPPSEKSTPMKEEQPRSTGEQPNVAQSATSESAPRVDTPGTKTAPPEKTLVPAPVLSAKPILSAYTDTDTLIGKKLAHSPVFRTARNNSGAWYRDEVLADKEFKSAVITIIPGPIDWKLVKDGQEQRAFWEAIPGVSTCASDLKILGETAPVLERKGLQAVLIAGPEYLYSLTTLVQSYPKLSVVSDYRGNFARGLNITPMPLWDQEFSPRLTLLVRDGKIEKAFSETADFRKSLAEMLSSVPDRIEPVQTAPVKPPTEQAAPKKLLGRKFDITKLDMKSPLPEGRALGQHPLLKADPYIPTPYAFQIALARGMEKVREEIGELPREYRMSVTISNGYRAFSYLVEPADIAANGDISRALLNQTASKNRSLSYLLTQLSSNASRLGLRLKVSANGDSNMDFEFMSNVPRYTPSLRLEIIKR